MIVRNLIALLILVLMVSGCSNVAHDNKKEADLREESSAVQINNPNKNDKVSLDNSSSWKKPVAKRLLFEFNDFYKKMQTDDSLFYNRIMAADRATGLLCVYKDYISSEELKDIKDKQDKINEKIGDSTVLFGYTTSGLHIVALIDMQNESSMNYEPACNLVRGYKQESKLFDDMFKERCYLSDIFIEDLSNKREKFVVNVESFLTNGSDFELRQEVKNISDQAKETLKKQNRTIEAKDGVYNNRTWKLIAIGSIFEFLSLRVDNEKIDLVKDASDKQSRRE